jgi:hypothetical protein
LISIKKQLKSRFFIETSGQAGFSPFLAGTHRYFFPAGSTPASLLFIVITFFFNLITQTISNEAPSTSGHGHRFGIFHLFGQEHRYAGRHVFRAGDKMRWPKNHVFPLPVALTSTLLQMINRQISRC